ncbi:terminase large subunit [Castellaniella ginsengisoli]|uniref:Terminase large subunit n=1 Tax=Castellaniella ginsengisoli TaxID=546114 RepID=A0AB39ESM3_9BURK
MAALPKWSTACLDWGRRIVAGESLITFDPLFPEQADAALRIFEQLKIVDLPGSPGMGDVSRKWVMDFVAAVFGAYDAATGRRLITEFFMLISKKNTKSTSAAAIMLTALLLNWRKSAELSIIAPTVEIAKNSYNPARDMIQADEELKAIFHVQDYTRTITDRRTGAVLSVVAADADTVGGKKSSIVLVDELWIFGKKAKAENMLREATGGLVSRPEGFVIYLSTQSDEPPAGVFKQKLQYARKVRDGEIVDPRFLPVIYEFPKEMLDAGEHRNPKNFYITNPNLGASVSEDDLVRMLSQAEESGEESVVGFLAKHLNVEIGLNLRSDRWMGADYWESQADREITLSYLLANCEVIDVGIDGGGLDDLLGLCVLGRHKVTKDWLAWCRAWAHPSVLERRKDIAPRLKDFAADGDLVLVDHIGEDVDELADIVSEVNETGLLDNVGADPAGIGSVLDALEEKGVPGDKLKAVSQGWKLSGTIKTAERRLAEGTLKHAGQPLMAWCVGNAKTVPVGNAINITKQVSGSAKIDPLMALFDAVQLMALNPDAPGNKPLVLAVLG